MQPPTSALLRVTTSVLHFVVAGQETVDVLGDPESFTTAVEMALTAFTDSMPDRMLLCACLGALHTQGQVLNNRKYRMTLQLVKLTDLHEALFTTMEEVTQVYPSLLILDHACLHLAEHNHACLHLAEHNCASAPVFRFQYVLDVCVLPDLVLCSSFSVAKLYQNAAEWVQVATPWDSNLCLATGIMLNRCCDSSLLQVRLHLTTGVVWQHVSHLLLCTRTAATERSYPSCIDIRVPCSHPTSPPSMKPYA